MTRRVTRSMTRRESRQNITEEPQHPRANDATNEEPGLTSQSSREPSPDSRIRDIPSRQDKRLPRKKRASSRGEEHDTIPINKTFSANEQGAINEQNSTTMNQTSGQTSGRAGTHLHTTIIDRISEADHAHEIPSTETTEQRGTSETGAENRPTTNPQRKPHSDQRQWWDRYAVLGSVSKDSELLKVEEAEQKLRRKRRRRHTETINERGTTTARSVLHNVQTTTQVEDLPHRRGNEETRSTNPLFVCAGIKTADEQQDLTEQLLRSSKRRRRRSRRREPQEQDITEVPTSHPAEEANQNEQSAAERQHITRETHDDDKAPPALEPHDEDEVSPPALAEDIDSAHAVLQPADDFEASHPVVQPADGTDSPQPVVQPSGQGETVNTEPTDEICSPSLQPPLPEEGVSPQQSVKTPAQDFENAETTVTGEARERNRDHVTVKSPRIPRTKGLAARLLPRRPGEEHRTASIPNETNQESRPSHPFQKHTPPHGAIQTRPTLRELFRPPQHTTSDGQGHTPVYTPPTPQLRSPTRKRSIQETLAGLPAGKEPAIEKGNIGDDMSLRIILNRTELLSLHEACHLAMGIQDRLIDITDVTPFQEGASVMQKWRSAWMHEIAAGLLADARGTNNEYVPYRVTAREKLESGVFTEVMSATRRPRTEQTLREYDVVMHSTNDGIRLLSVCMGGCGESGLQGFPMLVLHYYNQFQTRDMNITGTCRVTNLGNDFTIYRSLSRKTEFGLPSTISAFAEEKEDVISNLEDHRKQFIRDGKIELLTTPGKALPPRVCRGVSHKIATRYVEELCKRYFVNREQEEVIRSALAMQQYWDYAKLEERRELNRFLLVRGVPGCGKSYTAVFIITAILSYYNHRILSETPTRHSDATIMVCTKTNKALEVFMERLGAVDVPKRQNFNSWTKKSFRFYCKRSTQYMRREGPNISHYNGMTKEPDCVNGVPVILSTFGNLEHVRNEWHRAFDKIYACRSFLEYVRLHIKALIIDEGSQSTALDLLHYISMFPSFDGIIIILGDPLQMGPVVLSSMMEIKEFLSKSLFTQFSDKSQAAMVQETYLTYQYRMHPAIMNFANDIRYNGDMQYGHVKGEHDRRNIPRTCRRQLTTGGEYDVVLGPLVAYNTSEAPRHLFSFQNYQNWDELTVAAAVIASMKTAGYDRDDDVVFLSPYSEQCIAMRQICRRLGWKIHCSTVASYQGHDKSVVIYSAARRIGSGIGFLDDDRMITVSFTRAKDSLVIIGDLDHITKSARKCSVWTKTMDSLKCRETPILQAENILDLSSNAIDTVRSMHPAFHTYR